MTNKDDNSSAEREIIELLPWHAAGTLSASEAERVEQALARDPELARHFELAREELDETVHLNETLGAPSPRMAQRLFAAIDAEAGTRARTTPRAGLAGRLAQFVAGLAPRTLAWSAGAAALAILLQAGVIGTMLVSGQGSLFQTASYNDKAETDGGTVLIRFNPQATAAEIAEFLESYKASIVGGPMAGGVFRVRVPVKPGDADRLAQIVRQMQQSRIVGFVAASG